MKRRQLTSIFIAALVGSATALTPMASAGVTLTSDQQFGSTAMDNDSSSDGNGIAGDSLDAVAGDSADADPMVQSNMQKGTFQAVEPFRALDTRETSEGKVEGGRWIEIQVTGRSGVPSNAKAVSMNVTVTEPNDAGFLTVYPSGKKRPTASNVNYVAGQTIPNHVISAVGDNGKVRIYTMTTAHVVVDVTGYTPESSEYVGFTPKRVLDTREGIGGPTGKVDAKGNIAVQLTTEHCGALTNVEAVVVNLTATESEAPGFLTAYPSDKARPTASNLNYDKDETVAGLAIVPVNDDGTFTIYTHGKSHIVADLAGYIPKTDAFTAITPKRVLDTREDNYGDKGKLEKGREVTIDLAEYNIGNDKTGAAVINITATEAESSGFVTAYPTGTERPWASVVNFADGDTVANSMIAKVGDGRKITLYVSAKTHLVVDVQGTFKAFGKQSTPDPTPSEEPTGTPTTVPPVSPSPSEEPDTDVTIPGYPDSDDVFLDDIFTNTVHSGDVVVLRGMGFDDVTQVMLGDTEVAKMIRYSDVSMRIIVPEGLSGKHRVIFKTSDGMIETDKWLNIIDDSKIKATGFSKKRAKPGDELIINGEGLSGITGVMFGYLPAADFEVLSDDKIRVVVPEGIRGWRTITLSTASKDIETDLKVKIMKRGCGSTKPNCGTNPPMPTDTTTTAPMPTDTTTEEPDPVATTTADSPDDDATDTMTTAPDDTDDDVVISSVPVGIFIGWGPIGWISPSGDSIQWCKKGAGNCKFASSCFGIY